MSPTLARGRVPIPELAIERFELSCGAELLVSPRPGAPVTAARVHLRGGHSLDPEGLEGTAYLTGALLDQGTELHDEEELALLLEPHGASLSGDASRLSGTIQNDSWKLLLSSMAEVIQEPTYPRAKIELQKARLLDRLRVEEEDHRVQASRLFRRSIFGDHWLGRSPHGTYEGVARVERKHLKAFHKKHWVGCRALIAVCGDIDPKAVHRHLQRELRDWNPGRPLKPTSRDFPAPSPRSAAFTSPRQQVHLFLGHLGIRRSDPRFPALVVMDHILGTGPGFTNRLSRRLRDEDGLAYTVHADIHSSAGVFPGTFTAYIGTSPEHVPAAMAGFLEEMRRIRVEEVSREELELARDYLIGSFALGFERASRRANYLIAMRRQGLPEDNLERLMNAFAAVTTEDVRAAAAGALFPDAPCVTAGGPIKPTELRKILRTVLRT